MTNHFKVGDIVKLALGNGPEMFVTNFEATNLVSVIYFNDKSGLVVEQGLQGWALIKVRSIFDKSEHDNA